MIGVLNTRPRDQGAALSGTLGKAGFDPIEDRKRFHVTDQGITLITAGMLGQNLHHTR